MCAVAPQVTPDIVEEFQPSESEIMNYLRGSIVMNVKMPNWINALPQPILVILKELYEENRRMIKDIQALEQNTQGPSEPTSNDFHVYLTNGDKTNNFKQWEQQLSQNMKRFVYTFDVIRTESDKLFQENMVLRAERKKT